MRISDWSSDVCSSDLVGPLGRAMHQHCARIDELLDLQVLKGIDQALRAVYRNLLIERVRLARDVIIGSKVDDRGDAVPEPLPNFVNRRSAAILRAEDRKSVVQGKSV